MVQRQTKGETTMDTSSIPGLELIQVADVVAREKSIEREEVMLAMEEAIQKAGRAKYGLDRDIRAMIDRKTGAIRLERWIEVVEEVEDESMQMSLAEGAKQNPPLAAVNFGASLCRQSNLAGLPRKLQNRLFHKKCVMPNAHASLKNISTGLAKLLLVRSSGLKAIQSRLILAAPKR
jgi:hypothetical protein